MVNMRIGEKKVEATLLAEDIRSGKVFFDQGMKRVAEAAANALAGAAGKGTKVKGTPGAKSGVTSECVEEGEKKLDDLEETFVSTDPKKLERALAEGGGEQVSTANLGGALDTVMGMTLGLGVRPIDILPMGEEPRVASLQGKS